MLFLSGGGAAMNMGKNIFKGISFTSYFRGDIAAVSLALY